MRASQRLMALAIVFASACSASDTPGPLAFPETITFDRESLGKATSWNRGAMSGVVYVPPGQQMPAAATQVGVIISGDHLSAGALMTWVREQSGSEPIFHDSGGSDESCKVGGSPARTYVAIAACKTGVARAACVEVDQELDNSTFTSCVGGGGHYSCFEDLCNRQWLARREAMDLLAADVLTIR